MPHAIIKELIIAGDTLTIALGDPDRRGVEIGTWQSAVRSANHFCNEPGPSLCHDVGLLLRRGGNLVDVLTMRAPGIDIVNRTVQQWHDAVKKVLESDENVQGLDVTALQPSAKVTLAPTLLIDAADAIENRASQRDKPDGERSMRCAVNTFNALTGQQLSEREGWIFMVALKLARAQSGKHTRDDYVDGAGYLALACESVELEK